MDELIHNLTHDEDVLIPLIIFGTGTVIAVIAILTCSVRKMVVSSNVERSRREIAAYIAEGSMTPEEGERLLSAGKRQSTCV
jgi:hypothetical protein